MKIVTLIAVGLVVAGSGGATALPRHRGTSVHRKVVTKPPAPPQDQAAEVQKSAPDDLYRRRGTGQGGLVFGGGGQGIGQLGACADLAFARPPGCGAKGGYGVYGNGLGYGFGM